MAGELLFILHPSSTLDNTEETVVWVTANWGQEVLKDTVGSGMQADPADCRNGLSADRVSVLSRNELYSASD